MLPTSTYHLLWEPERTIEVDKESCTLQGTITFHLGKNKKNRLKSAPLGKDYVGSLEDTLLEINISHLGKRKIIFKYALSGGYVNSLEGTSSKIFCCMVGSQVQNTFNWDYQSKTSHTIGRIKTIQELGCKNGQWIQIRFKSLAHITNSFQLCINNILSVQYPQGSFKNKCISSQDV